MFTEIRIESSTDNSVKRRSKRSSGSFDETREKFEISSRNSTHGQSSRQHSEKETKRRPSIVELRSKAQGKPHFATVEKSVSAVVQRTSIFHFSIRFDFFNLIRFDKK